MTTLRAAINTILRKTPLPLLIAAFTLLIILALFMLQPEPEKKPVADILPLAEAEGLRRGWAEPVGAISYSASFGIYNPRFYGPGDDHGPGFGPKRLYIDDRTGEIAGDYLPGTGTPADIFVQLQFPLHSGRILGTAGRIIVSVMGIVIAALSVTGAVIWYRKRSARVASVRRRGIRAGGRDMDESGAGERGADGIPVA